MGSGRVPETPNAASAGREARIRTVFEVEPPTTKPAIRMSLPVPTATLAEMLIAAYVALAASGRRAGVGLTRKTCAGYPTGSI
jgi:hypothetical protein